MPTEEAVAGQPAPAEVAVVLRPGQARDSEESLLDHVGLFAELLDRKVGHDEGDALGNGQAEAGRVGRSHNFILELGGLLGEPCHIFAVVGSALNIRISGLNLWKLLLLLSRVVIRQELDGL